jgi:hypothetical protein
VSIGKGHLSAIGGLGKKELEDKMKRRTKHIPKLDIPAPPDLKEPKITEEIKAEDEVIEEIQQQETSIQIEVDDEEDEFQYYYDLKNRKLVSETTVQITLRLPTELNNEINRMGEGAKKGWKQGFITKAIEKELVRLKKGIIARNKKT